MLEILANRTYRHLFLAQVIALVGTGLATVALSLLAYDLARGKCGRGPGHGHGDQDGGLRRRGTSCRGIR
jgi:hypothetical protein